MLVGFQAAAGFDEVLRHDEAVEVVSEGLEFGLEDVLKDGDFVAGPGEGMADAAEDDEFVEQRRVERREDLEWYLVLNASSKSSTDLEYS